MKAKRRTKIIIAAALIVVLLINAIGIFAGNFLYNLSMNPDYDRSQVLSADHNSIDGWDETKDVHHEEAKAWFGQYATEERTLQSRDGLSLHASAAVRGDGSHLWAILCHGYTGRGSDNSSAGYHFYENGYNVLLPDARGHGESEGDYIGMGWDERLDIVDWISQIIDTDPQAQIVLYGVSMGGATVMMVSGEALPENVKAIIEDCGYTSAWDEFSYQLKMLFKLPEFPILNYASLVTKIRSGWWIGEGSAIEQVKKSETPMFFIHGGADTFVPTYMLREVYDAANCEKEILLVEDAAHAQSSVVLGDEYWDRVLSFAGKYVEG